MRPPGQFDYPGPHCMYDPVLKLRVAEQHGMDRSWDNVPIGIHYDPEIVEGRYWMERICAPGEQEIFERNGWDINRPVPFKSARSQWLVTIACQAYDIGHAIRLKIWDNDGRRFRGWEYRTAIERQRIQGISDDISSMYVSVFKAYPGLPSLRSDDYFSPKRFPRARSIELCVSSETLTHGLDRLASDYPLVEGGWHRISSWPMAVDY